MLTAVELDPGNRDLRVLKVRADVGDHLYASSAVLVRLVVCGGRERKAEGGRGIRNALLAVMLGDPTP